MTDYSVLKSRAGYGLEPLPCSVDVQIQGLMQSIRSGEDFTRVASEVPRNTWGMLSAFAERMASLAVRSGSISDIRDGLVAAQLSLILTDDFREVLQSVSLLYRASELVGVDPSQQFRAVAQLAGDPPENHLISFLERSPDKKRIERMGFTEGADETGFRFLYSG